MGIFFNGRFRRGQALAAQDGIIEKLNKVLDILENIRGEDGIRIDKNPIDGITVGLNSGEINDPSKSGGGSSGVCVTDVEEVYAPGGDSNVHQLKVSYSDGTHKTMTLGTKCATSVEWDSTNTKIHTVYSDGTYSDVQFYAYNY